MHVYAKKISGKRSQEINSRSGNVDQEGNFPLCSAVFELFNYEHELPIKFFLFLKNKSKILAPPRPQMHAVSGGYGAP